VRPNVVSLRKRALVLLPLASANGQNRPLSFGALATKIYMIIRKITTKYLFILRAVWFCA
jgi:hypothetical protein